MNTTKKMNEKNFVIFDSLYINSQHQKKIILDDTSALMNIEKIPNNNNKFYNSKYSYLILPNICK